VGAEAEDAGWDLLVKELMGDRLLFFIWKVRRD
jgi:hypothetical protein